MSSSLPRIRISSEINLQHENMKFKKLRFPSENDNGSIPERKKSLGVLKSSSKNSIDRYSTTVQQQREYRNHKIQMNLLQRKLQSGTYNVQVETAQNLTELKNKTSYYIVQGDKKKEEITKIQMYLRQIKNTIEQYNKEKQQKQKIIQQLEKKCQYRKNNMINTLMEHNVYENMINHRQNVNLFWRSQMMNSKQYLQKLKSMKDMVEIQKRQAMQKGKRSEFQLQKIKRQIQVTKKFRHDEIVEKKVNIHQRVKSQIILSQKSKQFLKMLDERNQSISKKQFNYYFDQILVQKFVRNYIKDAQNSIFKRFTTIQHDYKALCAYGTFKQEQPKTFVQRFMEQDKIIDELLLKTKGKEQIIQNLEKLNFKLKKQLANEELEERNILEKIQLKLQNQGDNEIQHKIYQIKKQQIQMQRKIERIRRQLNKVMKKTKVSVDGVNNDKPQKRMEKLQKMVSSILGEIQNKNK